MPSKISAKDEEIYKRIGKKIQEIRKEKGKTQEDIAETCGLAAKYIGFIEQGRKRPRLHILVKIAKSLDSDIKDLF